MKQLPLEDNFNDIIGKAMRGLGLSASDVSGRAGLPAERVQALVGGEFDEAAARKVAPLLGLDADALAASGKKAWRPKDVEIDGLAQFTTPWDDMMVNSYVVWDPASSQAAVFDTGADCQPMLDFLKEKNLRVVKIALTHTHGDHVFDLDRLKSKTGAGAVVGPREPLDGAEPTADQPFTIGALRVEARSTWGHSKGGLTYIVHGLSKPVAVDGDAVFAGSMGGGGVSYADALRTNREEILTLPEETILCPGHGPLTTVGEEKRHNPFFA
jgi:glyoxylase-like metal-dependent hydrolase (beta-lactamase superfamily II)